jgi:hypothetical protein
MGCTYVKEFSFGGKVTPAVAVHKHEKALHPDKPMTKMAKGGKVMEKATGEVYPSRKAMMKHEKEETPRMQREEIMQKSSMPQRPMPDPRTQMGTKAEMPQPPRDPRPMPDPKTQMGTQRPMPQRPMPQPPMPQRPMPRPQVTPPMMKKGGMHKMPDGKMMKNSAMKKGGMANPNC